MIRRINFRVRATSRFARPVPQRSRCRAGRLSLLLGLLTCVALPRPVLGQEEIRERIRESQQRLEQIRSERQALTIEAGQLRGQVHNVSEEIRNIEARIGSTSSLLTELDVQIFAYGEQVDIKSLVDYDCFVAGSPTY